MSRIEKLNIHSSVSRQNIQKLLGQAVKNRRGYYDQLYRLDHRCGETIEQFKTVGFINTGHTLKRETYSITELGDEYYQDLFGKWSYWGKRISGSIERFKNKIFNIKGE